MWSARGAHPGPASARSVAGAAEQGHQRHQRRTCRSGYQHRLDRLFLDVAHGLVLHTNRLIAQLRRAVAHGVDAAARQLLGFAGNTADRGQDKTVGYIKEEPVKAMLIAAAAGAALMALVALLGRSSNASR